VLEPARERVPVCVLVVGDSRQALDGSARRPELSVENQPVGLVDLTRRERLARPAKLGSRRQHGGARHCAARDLGHARGSNKANADHAFNDAGSAFCPTLPLDPAGDAYQVSLPVALAIAGTLTVLLGFAVTRVVRARRNPVAVGAHGLVGEEAVVRREGLVHVNGELWQAHTASGSPLSPGDHVRVERVEEGLQLVVGSPLSPNEEEAT